MFDTTSGRKVPESAGKWSSDPAAYASYRNGCNKTPPYEPEIDSFAACIANAALEVELAAQQAAFGGLYADSADIRPSLADKLWCERLVPGQKYLEELYA